MWSYDHIDLFRDLVAHEREETHCEDSEEIYVIIVANEREETQCEEI